MTVHLMTDIETLSTRPGAVILSAAFVRCSDEAHMVLNLSMPEQQALGMEIDPKTHAWWGEQEAKSPGIWARVTENPVPIAQALPYIAQWIQWAAAGSDWLIWCHGATFDCPLLDELYRRAGMESPWSYWQVRDTRTLYDLAGINPKDYAVPPPHIALNDALGQVRALVASLQILAWAHALPATAPKSQPNGLYCPICESPQSDTTSGVTCERGHGGAAGVTRAEIMDRSIPF